jgi:hypothetical protein
MLSVTVAGLGINYFHVRPGRLLSGLVVVRCSGQGRCWLWRYLWIQRDSPRILYNRHMILTASQAVASGSSNTAIIAIVVAVIALLSAIFSSITSARSAKSINESGLQAQRISELENRISNRKYEVYRPMIELLARIVTQADGLTPANVGPQMINFSAWLAIYGSNEAIVAFRNFRQASFKEGVPPVIYIRLYGEFVVAARRDIGQSDSETTLVNVLGMIASDLYTDQNVYEALSLPFDEVCRRQGWRAIWTEEAIGSQAREKSIADSGEGPSPSGPADENSPSSAP